MADPLEFLYDTRRDDRVPFGAKWCGPDKLKHGEAMLVARYAQYGDGQGVEVFCEAMPARFYTVKVAALACDGRSKPAYTLNTGSDEAQLAADIAHAVSRGMLGLGT